MSQTFVEFVQPVRDSSNRARLLATMYWLAEVEGEAAVSAARLRDMLTSAKVASASKINVSDVLTKAQSRVEWSKGATPWRLTDTGRKYVEHELGLTIAGPTSVQQGVDAIRRVLAGIGDEVAQGYVEEAIICLEVGALRASVVFLWSGSMRALQDRAMDSGATSVEAALQKHDPKAKLTKLDDFARVRDTTQLLTFRDLGLLDKGQWDTLDEGLRLRNRCGHPTKYTPGEAKVRAFIEDVVGIIF